MVDIRSGKMAGRDEGRTGAGCALKVLHVIPSVSLKHGGPSYAIKAYAKALKLQGVETVVVTTDDDGDGARFDVPLGVVIERDGIRHLFFRRNIFAYKISFSLHRWLDRHVREFDLVHIHALFSFSSFAAARASRKRGVPYIVRPLGVLSRWGIENRRPLLKRFWLRFIELPLLRSAAAVHYTTEAERNEACAVHPALAAVPSFVVPIPVEAPISPGEAGDFVRLFPKAKGKKLVLFLSRLDAKKGLDLLLHAFRDVKEAEPESLLVIAGSGEKRYTEPIHRLADQLRIAEDILWTGHLGPAEKSAAFAAATVFVLPSHSENFGIVAAEALAAGVPTVLSDQVAIARDVAAANAAVVVSRNSPELSAAIVQLLGNDQMRNELSKRGAAAAQQFFSPQSTGMLLRSEYTRILERPRK
jgi:glycosyltransferase involved in cell wall biosynthesis